MSNLTTKPRLSLTSGSLLCVSPLVQQSHVDLTIALSSAVGVRSCPACNPEQQLLPVVDPELHCALSLPHHLKPMFCSSTNQTSPSIHPSPSILLWRIHTSAFAFASHIPPHIPTCMHACTCSLTIVTAHHPSPHFHFHESPHHPPRCV